MNYGELERYAAIVSGIAAAGITTAVEIGMGMGPIEIIFSIGSMLVIGSGVFLQITDMIEKIRAKKERKRRRRKRIDFTVGKEIPSMPGYVEVAK